MAGMSPPPLQRQRVWGWLWGREESKDSSAWDMNGVCVPGLRAEPLGGWGEEANPGKAPHEMGHLGDRSGSLCLHCERRRLAGVYTPGFEGARLQ